MKNDLSEIKRISHDGFKKPNNITKDDILLIEKILNEKDNNLIAKTFWAIGQIGINKPELVEKFINQAFIALNNEFPEIRENALFAIGRTGRSKIELIQYRIQEILDMHNDPHSKVRLAMIWACENIANTNSLLFEQYIPIFEHMLDDQDEKYVRGEAPVIFRVIGKYSPKLVERSLPKLKEKLNDSYRVTRIHCAGAIKTIEKNLPATAAKSAGK